MVTRRTLTPKLQVRVLYPQRQFDCQVIKGRLRSVKSAEKCVKRTLKESKSDKKNVCIHIGPDIDYCALCGNIVPEGTNVCYNCFNDYLGNE